MTDALKRFELASKLVKEGRLDAAMTMKDVLLKSDWGIIERRIAEAQAKDAPPR